jgi:hypothetical protein
MDDEKPMTEYDREALVVELVCNIDMRGGEGDDVVLFRLLTAAWPTRRAQHC